MAATNNEVPKQRSATDAERQAAKFANNQRNAYKDKSLPSERQRALLEIPGWTWGSGQDGKNSTTKGAESTKKKPAAMIKDLRSSGSDHMPNH